MAQILSKSQIRPSLVYNLIKNEKQKTIKILTFRQNNYIHMYTIYQIYIYSINLELILTI